MSCHTGHNMRHCSSSKDSKVRFAKCSHKLRQPPIITVTLIRMVYRLYVAISFGSLLMPSRRLSSSFASRATLDPLSAPHARSPHPATRSHGSTFELSLVLRTEFQKRQWWQWPIAIPGTHPQKIHQHPSPEMRWWKAGNPGSTEYLLQERLESMRVYPAPKRMEIWCVYFPVFIPTYTLIKHISDEIILQQMGSNLPRQKRIPLPCNPYPTHTLWRVNLVTKCLPLRSHVNFPLTK